MGEPESPPNELPNPPGDSVPERPDFTPDRPVVLVGLMGAGKSCIGRMLAQRLHLPFVDSDAEIENAAACSIEDIFELYGETAFRDCERRVLSRLVGGHPRIIATGGGAFMDERTRTNIAGLGVSLWLRAELDVLLKRVSRRTNRPLLNEGDPREILEDLMRRRYPVYAEASLTVESEDVPPEETVNRVLEALGDWFRNASPA